MRCLLYDLRAGTVGRSAARLDTSFAHHAFGGVPGSVAGRVGGLALAFHEKTLYNNFLH